jgi:CRP-like cAMP-binding protein
VTESQRIELLENIPGFQKMPYDPLRALVSYMEFVGYERGKTLYREGDPSNYFGFILSGEVGLGKGMDPAADRVTFLVKSRRGIGFSFFDEGPREVSARALTKTKVALMTKVELKRLELERGALALSLYEIVMFFLCQTVREITSLVVDNVNLIEHKTGRKFADVVHEQFAGIYGLEAYTRLSDKWLERLAESVRFVEYDRGAVIYEEYAASDFFGYIVDGEVEFIKSRSDRMRGSLGALGKGMMVGTSVFDDYLRATTARAVTPVTLAVIEKEELERIKKEEPPLAMELHRDAVHCAMQVLRKLAALTLNYIDIVR